MAKSPTTSLSAPDLFFRALLAFIPISIAADFLHAPPVAVFFLSALAIIPLARFIGEATEELSTHVGVAMGGFLNATFGNATELIIGIFAVKAGLFEVVKATITGSVIGNLLLVLGSAMLVGGWKRKEQRFNRAAAMAGGSTLMVSVIALAIPAIFIQTAPGVADHVEIILSLCVAGLMLIGYAGHLWFSLKTHVHLFTEEAAEVETARWSKTKSMVVLLLSTITVSFMSELLVGSIEPVVAHLGWSELFIGVVVIAILGNAAEHTSAIMAAAKNHVNLALQTTMGSATQMVLLVAPLLVVISLFFGRPMDLVFSQFELVCVILSVVIINLVVADGESNWLEGLQLLIAYAIMAVAFFFHP